MEKEINQKLTKGEEELLDIDNWLREKAKDKYEVKEQAEQELQVIEKEIEELELLLKLKWE